jgi:membrane fusion protein (multidrug efflux system)
MKHGIRVVSARLSVLLCVVLLVSCTENNSSSGRAGPSGGPPGAGAPPEVGVVTLHPEQIPFTASVPGRTVASAVAEIRPQVSGIIQKRVFKEGSQVKAGDQLYQLDDRPYRAALASAQASVAKAQATTANAQAEFERATQLRERNVGSQQAVDTAKAALLQAQADLAAANAAVQTAQINLDNTTVKAPISGLIATSAASEGALVTANQTTALTIIRQVDPMYVDLTESSATLLRVRRMIEEGTVQRDPQGAKVHLVLEDGRAYSQVGSIQAFEGSVSETTGTVTIRSSIPNPDRLLLPGMYVRATVEVGTGGTAFLVPQRAVSRNPKGQATAMFVTADGKAELRVLPADHAYRNSWVVRDGVKEGDRLIVDGLQKVRGGQAVVATEVRLDEQGLVQAATPATAQTQ